MQIDLTFKNYRCFSDANPVTLSLRNGFTAFVGKNNAGKSALLRSLYEFRGLFALLADAGTFVQMLNGIAAFSVPSTVQDPSALAHDKNERDIEITLRYSDPGWDPTDTPERIVLNIPRASNTVKAELFLQNGDKAITTNVGRRDALMTFGSYRFNFEHLALVSRELTDCFYIAAYRNAINAGENNAYYDIQVGRAFVRQWKGMQTGAIKTQRDVTYQLTAQIKEIFDFDDLQIHASSDEEALRVFVDGKSLDLVEMGAGITQFILVLANLATRKASFVLIDEPELNLHASLQLDFLTTLGSYASSGVILATHSYGLARSSADFVYSVSKQPDGSSSVRPLEETASLTELLGALSFSQVPELGFNKILLVESPTDGRAIQQWLRWFRKEHEVLLLPLGGSTLINGTSTTRVQLQEVMRITRNVSALIDSERKKGGAALDSNRNEFQALCGELGIACHLTERRALENYFPQRAIDEGIGPGRVGLQPFEALAGNVWQKSKNWQIARCMTKAELSQTDIGKFLENL